MLDFIAAGATGTYGTVSEPCAFASKFPDLRIVISRYLNGASLVEAYWKSVRNPFQGLFVGDLLATPWDMQPKFVDGLRPSAPQTLQARRISDDSIELTWPSAIDNVAVRGYQIYLNGTPVKWIAAPASNIVTFTYQGWIWFVSGFSGGRLNYSVVATDSDENESSPTQTEIVIPRCTNGCGGGGG